jgi:hypothetical protein
VSCQHIQAAVLPPGPDGSTVEGCPDCLAQGFHDWVHLRQCLECGHVGCCDSSPRRHATGHFNLTGHPVMRSLEPGETWKWCFVDETIG